MSQPWSTNTVDGVIRRSAARNGAGVAIRFGDRSWTYRELDDGISRVAGRLLAAGLRAGDRVAAYGRNSDAYLLLFLGCARAGLVHVPVNYALTGDELVYLVNQSGSSALYVDEALAPAADAVADQLGVRRRGLLRPATEGSSADSVLAWATSGEVPVLEVTVDDDDLAQLLYTSGTTSRPKGAMLSHRALLHEYMSCLVGLDLSADDRPLHALPLYHSAQMHVFLMPYLMLGATNELVEAPDPADVVRRIAEDGVSTFFAPPTVWIAIANHPDFGPDRMAGLRKAYYGAAIMPTPVLERLREILPDLAFYNCFGQSEISPLATVLRPDEHDRRPDSAGRPALFVELRVVDDNGADVPPGELGEVVYRSPQLCSGYWDKPEETAAAFTDGWFHSGDLVRQDDEGFIYVVDRVKDVINTGGVLVASREVEEVIYGLPVVAEVAVIALSDPKWIEAVTAVVVTKAGASLSEEAVITHVRGELAPFKVPKRVIFVPELPKNASGKLLKRELRQQYES